MGRKHIKIAYILVLSVLFLAVMLAGCGNKDKPHKISILILPNFEVEEMSGDYPGEAQYYYDAYVKGGEEYDIKGSPEGSKLYVKDDMALYVIGTGKANAAASTAAVLLDDRFDFSEAYVILTGCGGGAAGNTIMGDVVLGTAVADYELGHHADPRDMENPDRETWFYDDDYDSSSHKILDQQLMSKLYDEVKDVKLQTTEHTRRFLEKGYDGAEWVLREPKVIRGTVVTGDNYWKGEYDDRNAKLIARTYKCPDPFALTEMEDMAAATVLDRMGMLDRTIIIRACVNMDTFEKGMTPEKLWGDDSMDLAEGESEEVADIFETAMENNYKVGSKIIEAVR